MKVAQNKKIDEPLLLHPLRNESQFVKVKFVSHFFNIQHFVSSNMKKKINIKVKIDKMQRNRNN